MASELPEILDVREVARRIGQDREFVLNLIGQRKLRCFKAMNGGNLLVTSYALIAYLRGTGAEIAEPSNPPPDDAAQSVGYLTAKQAAALVGLTPNMIRRWWKAGILRALKLGRAESSRIRLREDWFCEDILRITGTRVRRAVAGPRPTEQEIYVSDCRLAAVLGIEPPPPPGCDRRRSATA